MRAMIDLRSAPADALFSGGTLSGGCGPGARVYTARAHTSIALLMLRRLGEIYEPVIEVLAGDSVDRGGDRVEPAGTT